MANVQWSVIRQASGMLLHCENKLEDARDKVDKARNMLEGKQQSIEKLSKQLKRCLKKHTKATIDEQRAGYQAQVSTLEASRRILEAEVARYAEDLEGKRASMLELDEERKKGRMEIEEMLRVFETDKWVTIMGIEDAAAVRMFSELEKVGKKLTFTIGGSLREKATTSICLVMRELGLEQLESQRFYRLSETGFRMLSDEEKRKLEGGNRKSRRTERKRQETK